MGARRELQLWKARPRLALQYWVELEPSVAAHTVIPYQRATAERWHA